MSAERLALNGELFQPIRCTEETIEGILRSNGHALFEGLHYYDFRPPISSRYGARHPDGALVAPGYDRWWVVEIEVYAHDVEAHIVPQLQGLAEGLYGWDAFRYLTRHPGFDLQDYTDVDVWEPSFLLIVDHATPHIRAAVARSSFDLLECSVFKSESNQYAMTVNGNPPRRSEPSLPAGVDVRLEEAGGIALLVPMGGKRVRTVYEGHLLVGGHQVQPRVTSDAKGIALPLTPDQIHDLIGPADCYRLTLDGILSPADTSATRRPPEHADRPASY